jgi:hypothetical protein
VLSNFQKLSKGNLGGLSGVFIPVSLPGKSFPSFLTVSSWGRLKDSENKWSTPDDIIEKGGEWSSLGYVASLDPATINDTVPACMLGFTVHRFPRDTPRWKSVDGLVDFQLRKATEDSGNLIFRRWEDQ